MSPNDDRQGIDPDTWNEDVAEKCGRHPLRLAARGLNSTVRAKYMVALAKATIEGIDDPRHSSARAVTGASSVGLFGRKT